MDIANASTGTVADAFLEAEETLPARRRRGPTAHWLRIAATVLRGGQVPVEWSDPFRRRLLALADIAATAATIGALSISVHGEALLVAAACSPLAIVAAKLFGLYDRDHRRLRHLTVDELSILLLWASATTAALSVLVGSTRHTPLGMGTVFRLWIVASVAIVLFRVGARAAWRATTPRERTAIIGSGALAAATVRKLELFPDIHVDVAARIETLDAVDPSSEAWLEGVDRVLVASEFVDEALIALLVALCRRRGIKFSVVPPARGMFGTAVQLSHVADLAMIDYNTWEVGPSTLMLKRAIDLVGSAVGLVVLAPVALLVSIAIKIDDRGPVIFVQTRAGRDGVPFRTFKFRTMVIDAETRLKDIVALDELEVPMFKFFDDPRVTRVGRVLRRLSLDEIPQLVNVLRGEMSLVGPRPEQLDLVERYQPQHRFRLRVKPGLTGPMQVYGRGSLTFEERLAVEREYIENLSIGHDLRILALTFAPLLTGRGAS